MRSVRAAQHMQWQCNAATTHATAMLHTTQAMLHTTAVPSHCYESHLGCSWGRHIDGCGVAAGGFLSLPHCNSKDRVAVGC